MILRDLAALVVFASVSTCGGGGNPVGGSLPPPRANTPLTAYLPLSNGNSWSFGSGTVERDNGPVTVACGCPLASLSVEQIDSYDSTQAYGGSLFFAKLAPTSGTSAGHHLTYLVALSTDHGATLFYPSDSNDGSPGVVVMDDTPTVSEHFDDFNGTATSTITSVNATQPYQSEQITSIAVDALAAPAWNGNLGLAQGVGFTGLTTAAGTTTLSAFTVGPSSQAIRRKPAASTITEGVPAATFLAGAGQILNSAVTGHSVLEQ